MSARSVLRHHFRHFNAKTLVEAADGWVRHLEGGGQMMLAMAGAMSTAQLGVSLAQMIRAGKIHAISCTGANLEEDLFGLVAREHYVPVPGWRNFTPDDEAALRDKGLNRVTDVCIPEDLAMRKVEAPLIELWKKAAREGTRRFPHEYLYELLLHSDLPKQAQIDPRNSWLLAAAEVGLPLFVPGWEDSTLGNVYAAQVWRGEVPSTVVKTGVEYMTRLIDWYKETSQARSVGFFQIGGGISGDFALCVVPLIQLDLGARETRRWGYYCQVGDSTTSYGSYSGCTPKEKITWSKLEPTTPSFVIESDATIVAPLVFSYVLDDWGLSRAAS